MRKQDNRPSPEPLNMELILPRATGKGGLLYLTCFCLIPGSRVIKWRIFIANSPSYLYIYTYMHTYMMLQLDMHCNPGT